MIKTRSTLLFLSLSLSYSDYSDHCVFSPPIQLSKLQPDPRPIFENYYYVYSAPSKLQLLILISIYILHFSYLNRVEKYEKKTKYDLFPKSPYTSRNTDKLSASRKTNHQPYMKRAIATSFIEQQRYYPSSLPTSLLWTFVIKSSSFPFIIIEITHARY